MISWFFSVYIFTFLVISLRYLYWLLSHSSISFSYSIILFKISTYHIIPYSRYYFYQCLPFPTVSDSTVAHRNWAIGTYISIIILNYFFIHLFRYLFTYLLTFSLFVYLIVYLLSRQLLFHLSLNLFIHWITCPFICAFLSHDYNHPSQVVSNINKV